MAIRFDASGDSLSRARLAGAKTVMAWVYITTDRNDYTVFFGLGSNELIGTGGDGTTLLHYDGTMERTGSNLSTGTWFHLAYVSNGDALANGFTVYLNGAADITYTVRSLTSAGTNMYLGNDEYSEWLNGRMAHVKIWNVALTAAEIQQEMYSSRPQRFTNLWSWLPMIESGSGRNSEWSSSGNTWTANGTLADEDGPPVAWNLTGWQLPFV
ncbi:MAG TPA: LamG domain-containing protein, partial [Nitrospira sp.]|nr:LamG domain-containing protein [Nitrospira sp.]